MRNASIDKDGGSRWLEQGPEDYVFHGPFLLVGHIVQGDSKSWSYLGRKAIFLRQTFLNVKLIHKFQILGNLLQVRTDVFQLLDTQVPSMPLFHAGSNLQLHCVYVPYHISI